MALGMRDPSHWGPKDTFKEPTKKTLTPTRTWNVKSSFTDRELTIEQNDSSLYKTKSHLKIKPLVTIHNKDDSKTAVGGVKLDGKGSYHIVLGDPSAESGVGAQECNVELGGGRLSREYHFSPPSERKNYAWRDTQQREITIADTESKTSGRDWKFISLNSDGEEDELLAVYVGHAKTSFSKKAQIFWFADVSDDLELWALAAVVGLVEKQRKSQDRLNLTTGFALGATG